MYHRPMESVSCDVTAFILAGGKSRRMGTDKAFVTLEGRTLLARALDLARAVSPEVRIVGDSAKFSTFAPVVEDIFPNCGPLGGIHAALRSSPTDLNLILAVDVPFITAAFLQFLFAHGRASAASVTAVRTSDGWQPLCAVYRRQFADTAEESLRQGRYKIDTLFDEADTRVIDRNELEAAGFSDELFRNLNTPEELTQATQPRPQK